MANVNPPGIGVSGLVNAAPSFRLIPTTWANKPAAGNAGTQIMVSDAGTKGSFWEDDGARWKPFNGAAELATLDGPSAAIGNTQTIVKQYQMPTAFWQVGDIVRVYASLSKTGTTDSGTLKINIGILGTISDASVFSGTVLAAANHQWAGILDILLVDSTHVQLLNNNNGYGGATGNTLGTPVVVAPSNRLWIDASIQSGGTTDTIVLQQCTIEYRSSAN